MKFILALCTALLVSWGLMSWFPSLRHHAFNLLNVNVSYIYVVFMLLLVFCTKIAHSK
jgi:hypothetical protein